MSVGRRTTGGFTSRALCLGLSWPPSNAFHLQPATESRLCDLHLLSRSTPYELRSGLTFDRVQDFFGAKIGSTKKILLSYGPNGRSRGEASVTFSRPDSAIKAHKEYNNVVVDTRPMKVRSRLRLQDSQLLILAYRSRL